jgi:hypothetical protein
MNNKSVLIIAVISVFINVILIYVFLFKGQTASVNETRTTLKMSQSNQEFVMDEMRTFLESVQQINEGILNEDVDLIIKAAEKSGGSVIAHAPKGMLKSLPMGFKKLGFATHDTFDAIAEEAKSNFNPKQTQHQLNTLLNNCTACHKSYKIEINKP